jgi:OmpA-OmpF porin, OOP family
VAVNLVEAAKALLTSDVVRELSDKLGDNPEHLEAALAAGIPTVLASLLQKASSGGAGELIEVMREDPADLRELGGLDGLSGNLGTLVSGDSAEHIITYGHHLLDNVLGGRLHPVVDALARSTGVDPGRASSLLAMLAPVVMGIVRNHAAAQGFSATELKDLLLAQKDEIARHAPSGLAPALGLPSLADLGRPATSFATAGAGSSHEPSRTPWLGLVTAVAVLALAAFGYLYFFGGGKAAVQEQGAAPNVALLVRNLPKNSVRSQIPAAKDTAKTTNGQPLIETTEKLVTIDLPGDTKLAVPQHSYLVAMVASISDGENQERRVFVADDLTFEGSPLKVADESSGAINNLALLLKSFKTSKLKVENHVLTVSGGDEAAAKKTALDQATAVKDALVAAGVPAERITALATGLVPTEHSERGKNYRIELSIVAK